MKTTCDLFLACIFLVVLNGCLATSAAAVPQGSRVIVRLYDAGSGIVLALANESHPTLQEVYSHARADASLKLAPDQLMGELLAALDRAGFALHGQPGEAPDRGNRSYLLVDRDGQQIVFAEPARSADPETRQAFIHMKLLMDHYYTPVGGLQFIDNAQGGAFFGDRN
jgi:hypothetical protein